MHFSSSEVSDLGTLRSPCDLLCSYHCLHSTPSSLVFRNPEFSLLRSNEELHAFYSGRNQPSFFFTELFLLISIDRFISVILHLPKIRPFFRNLQKSRVFKSLLIGPWDERSSLEPHGYEAEPAWKYWYIFRVLAYSSNFIILIMKYTADPWTTQEVRGTAKNPHITFDSPETYSHLSESKGNWFQDLPWILKSMNAKALYKME